MKIVHPVCMPFMQFYTELSSDYLPSNLTSPRNAGCGLYLGFGAKCLQLLQLHLENRIRNVNIPRIGLKMVL